MQLLGSSNIEVKARMFKEKLGMSIPLRVFRRIVLCAVISTAGEFPQHNIYYSFITSLRVAKNVAHLIGGKAVMSLSLRSQVSNFAVLLTRKDIGVKIDWTLQVRNSTDCTRAAEGLVARDQTFLPYFIALVVGDGIESNFALAGGVSSWV